ncbi:hypothetical protein PHYPSEUDO_002597 [Phytophthora pseudosyringae]|uniref:FYVE-type domain-containing protein n=1 Tax=Phytophthora pseudosyringae TaxID=221518 RepID=A0A8T1VWM7_9STRA|nr:hypothetical protein PHYPSEUDO_002597 [Phytophthora pseudosyringae]
MHAPGPDHPVFTRLSRAQLVARRRHIGLQSLIFDVPSSGSSVRSRVKLCAYCCRMFTTDWKPYLCHVCGQWVCEPCSRVMEREREEQVIRFVRCCESCLPLLNKWTPNVDKMMAFTFGPWVVSSCASPLGVNLTETLRSHPERRHAASTESSSHAPLDTAAEQRSNSRLIRGAQHFVQQCLDVQIQEIPLEKCVLAEEDGRRHYPLTYESPVNVPLVPNHPRESEREEWITRGHWRRLCGGEGPPVVRPACARRQRRLGQRAQAVVLVALSGNKPLLVRNLQLDVRFRNLQVATSTSSLSFFLGVPVLAGDGVVVATLRALDSKPRRNITTMQYSVMLALARVLSAVWEELYVSGDDDCSIPEEMDDAPWPLRLRTPRGSGSGKGGGELERRSLGVW